MNKTHSELKPASSLLIGLALTMVMIVWGGSFIAIKVGLKYLTPYELILARFIPSVILLWLFYLWKRRKSEKKSGLWTALKKSERFALIISGFLAVPAYHFCLNFGETIIPAGWAGLVISLNPASITILAAFYLREPIGSRRWLGVFLAFSGIVFIALTHDLLAEDGKALPWYIETAGIVITLGAVVSWGGFVVLSKRLITHHDPLLVLTWSLGLGTLYAIPGLRFSLFGKMAAAPAELWVSIVFLSVFCTVAAFVVWYWALRQWDASRAGAFIYLVPLFALALGQWLLSEKIDLMIVVGAVGVIGGVVLAGTKIVKRV